jgi:hypothetical protein
MDDKSTMLADREMDALIAEKVMGKPPLCRLIGDGINDPLRLDVPGATWRERSTADRYWERFSPDGSELRAVVDAADKYDRCKGSYPALRLALNRWRKTEKARQPEKGEAR